MRGYGVQEKLVDVIERIYDLGMVKFEMEGVADPHFIQMVILDLKKHLTIDMIATPISHSFTPKHSVARIFVSIL